MGHIFGFVTTGNISSYTEYDGYLELSIAVVEQAIADYVYLKKRNLQKPSNKIGRPIYSFNSTKKYIEHIAKQFGTDEDVRALFDRLDKEAMGEIPKKHKPYHNVGKSGRIKNYAIERDGRPTGVRIVELNKEFDSIAQANIFLGVSKRNSHIGQCLRGERETYLGYHFIKV